MVKNPAILKKFEDEFLKSEARLSFEQSLNIFTSLWNEAAMLGVMPPKDPLDQIEVDVKIARALNTCSRNSLHG
ncbi:MAG: hypothetical protein HY026_00755 [Deltaproteobacteria bacterium]|nr:hypothetical protein [Deltaproteobacteria bacterium]